MRAPHAAPSIRREQWSHTPPDRPASLRPRLARASPGAPRLGPRSPWGKACQPCRPGRDAGSRGRSPPADRRHAGFSRKRTPAPEPPRSCRSRTTAPCRTAKRGWRCDVRRADLSRRHAPAVHARAEQAVGVVLRHLEELHGVAQAIAGKAFLAKHLVLERDGRSRRVGRPHQQPFGRRLRLDLAERTEPPRRIALQKLGPTLQPLAAGHGAPFRNAHFGDVAELFHALILH